MSWFLVDDQYPTHAGVMATSLAARGLWATAGAWSSAHHTDVVPDPVLAAFGSTPELVGELVAARLWKRVKGGYEFQQEGTCKIPSKEAVENSRKSKTERQARWRARQRAGDARVDGAVDAPVDAVDNPDTKVGAQNSRPPPHGRRNVDASTPPSTWSPDPGPDPDPVVDVVNRVNGSNAHPPQAVIDAITKEIHETTGKHVTETWAAKIAATLLTGRTTASPAAYVRQAIRNDPDPKTRFLPLY